MKLTTENATYAWNYYANGSPEVLKDVTCEEYNPNPNAEAPKAKIMLI